MNLLPWTEREKKLLLLVLFLALLLLSGGVYSWLQGQPGRVVPHVPSASTPEPIVLGSEVGSELPNVSDFPAPAPPPIEVWAVDVKGAVLSPGVYEVAAGDRVLDAVEKAGGFLPEANQDALNLAQHLIDGMVVAVPAKGEEAAAELGYSVLTAPAGSGLVRVNIADVDELQQLPGIGPAKAAAMIRYREENGPFRSVEEVTQVNGIGKKTLEQMREQISLQ